MEYDAKIAELRRQELPALYGSSSSSAGSSSRALYLDAAGMPPCPSSAIQAFAQDISTNFYANPHSHSPASVRSAELIEEVREEVLREIFNLHTGLSASSKDRKGKGRAIESSCGWELIFTSGATTSLKLAAESFEFAQDAQLLYLLESHTSVAGLRGVVPPSVQAHALEEGDIRTRMAGAKEGDLVVLPLQCNATGRRYTDLLRTSSRAKVLVDAASYLSSSTRLPLPSSADIEAYNAAPDFIAFSFYKIFGAPTGVGGLLVKSSSAHALSAKRYFGGGTLALLLPESGKAVPRERLADRMEDGTLNLHGIVALRHAMRVHNELLGEWEERRQHVELLTDRLYQQLKSLRHSNGAPLVQLLSRESTEQGPIAAFVLLLQDGKRVPMSEVSRIASLRNVNLRVGRHCNAGAALRAASAPLNNSSRAGDDALWEIWEQGTGCENADGADDRASSARVSLSVWNTLSDVNAFIAFLRRYFLVESPAQTSALRQANDDESAYELRSIVIYPVKSCAGQELKEEEEWPVTPYGLLHDREWCIVDLATGRALSQKRIPKMATIRARVDRRRRLLVLSLPLAEEQIEVDLRETCEAEQATSVRVCADQVEPQICRDERIRQVLSDYLSRDCTLARLPPDTSTRHGHFEKTSQAVSLGLDGAVPVHAPILLSNESPFLLINEESVRQVARWMEEDGEHPLDSSIADIARRFRANFVFGEKEYGLTSIDSRSDGEDSIDTPPTSPPSSRASSRNSKTFFHPFTEDRIARVQIGNLTFASLGACRRCEMVAIDQETGLKRPETLLSLSARRRNANGRVDFGTHLCWLGGDQKQALVKLGMHVSLH